MYFSPSIDSLFKSPFVNITFQPNTLVYAVPAKSDLAKTMLKANLGVVWHTTYKGKDFASMKASFGVNLKGLKKKPSVWYQDADLQDLSGTATLTKLDTEEVTQALSKAGKIFQKIKSTTLSELESNQALAIKLETFNNTLFRFYAFRILSYTFGQTTR